MGHRTAAADAKTIAGAKEQAREDAEEAKEHAVVPAEAEMEQYAEVRESNGATKKLAEPRRGDGRRAEPREEKANAVTEVKEMERDVETEERADA